MLTRSLTAARKAGGYCLGSAKCQFFAVGSTGKCTECGNPEAFAVLEKRRNAAFRLALDMCPFVRLATGDQEDRFFFTAQAAIIHYAAVAEWDNLIGFLVGCHNRDFASVLFDPHTIKCLIIETRARVSLPGSRERNKIEAALLSFCYRPMDCVDADTASVVQCYYGHDWTRTAQDAESWVPVLRKHLDIYNGKFNV